MRVWRCGPSLRAFRMPLWVSRSRRRRTVFGQARPGARGELVRIQFPYHNGHYRTLACVTLRNLSRLLRQALPAPSRLLAPAVA
jgi:hypothetical protein